VSRAPLNHEVTIQYDANGNPIAATIAFDHYQYDPVKNTVVRQSSTIRQRLAYNVLNNIIRRTFIADDREIVATFLRDATENIVRKIQPLGNVTEYRFDERNLLLERRLGVGTKEETAVRYTYTPNGRRRSITNGRGDTICYDYDGFHRYRGFTNAGGTTKKQWFDEVDNITRIEVIGEAGLVDAYGEPTKARALSLLETRCQYDELNRRVRVDHAWRDAPTGEPLGNSQWAGEAGMVSTVIEYADNHRPAKIWYETGNVLRLEYDGANRVVAASDVTGESMAIEYDENSNPVRIDQLGPGVEGDEERFEQVIAQQFDALDRLVTRSANWELPETFTYNALGSLIAYRSRGGVETQQLHDGLGRWIGQASTAIAPLLVHRVELDDNNRIVARINAAGRRTQYHYDTLNRRAAVIYPDGTTKHFARDGNGNVVRIVDQNRHVITHHFDSLNRLAEHHIAPPNGGRPRVERFHYDGLNRIVAAVTSGVTITHRYDSLSRLLEETQAGRTMQYGYDAAGNRTRLRYPSGQAVVKSYDPLKRVTDVRDSTNSRIAQYTYRASGEILRQQLGNALEATLAYQPCQGCIREVVYRSTSDGQLIEGSRYLYDRAGNRTQEAQLYQGETFGERYTYDRINRLVGVQYGVQDLHDPNSAFVRDVQYDLSPAGIWQHKTVRDGTGRIVASLDGQTNDRDASRTLGSRRFAYDANGNRILEANGEDEDCAEKHTFTTMRTGPYRSSAWTPMAE